MTIRHLKTFIKVCELGSISRTAEELCVAQPSVSQTIIELEKYYNITLFKRVNRHLVLTREGEILLVKAKEVIASFTEFEELTRNLDTKPDIYIGSSMAFGEIVLPAFLERIKKQMPDVDPRLYIEKPDVLEAMILSGDLDFAIAEGLVSNPHIKTELVGKDRLVAVCAPGYKAPNKLKLHELVDYDLLVREKGSAPRRIIDYRLAIKGVKIENPRMESASNLVIIQLAKSGLGIGLLAEDVVKPYLDSGELREIELDIPLERNLFLIRHITKRFTSAERKAYQICKAILTEKTAD